MGGRAKSNAALKIQAADKKAELQRIAVERYREELAKPSPRDRKGARKICDEVELEHKCKTGRSVHLNHCTIINHADGGRTIKEFNAEKRWLTLEEEETVLQAIEQASMQGFPLSHWRLKEHVDSILKARLGEKFPEGGVSGSWTNRFVARHSKRVKAMWSTTLDGARAQAVNPITNAQWFDVMGDEVKDVALECLWAADETGIQTIMGGREKVLGKADKKIQHQKRDGNRENITVIVTIGADGSSIAPAVIFKGQGFLPSWEQENPLKASLGYSKKGWTDGEIGRAWIEDFDKKTREKANGRKRVLLVDGHNSHYTMEFLFYAREHNISVLCYPSHATHVYQGLDVVIFSPLKKAWQRARDAAEVNGSKVTKSTFLAVYAKAHIEAVTPENVKAAFRKTGVYPFDRSVITEEMMAPSRQTSTQPVAFLDPSTPVRNMTTVHGVANQAAQREEEESSSIGSEDENDSDEDVNIPRELLATFERLSQDSQHPLFQPQPLTSQVEPPSFDPFQFSPVKRRGDLLMFEPQTEREQLMQEALRDAEIREVYHKGQLHGQQAAIVMQNIYCGRVRGQLAYDESKKKKTKSKTAMKVKEANKKGRLLTDDRMTELYAEHHAEIQAKKREELKKKVITKKWKAAVAKWEKDEEKQKWQCEEIKAKWRKDVASWEKERDLAKAEKRKARWTKPKCPEMPKALPKPRKKDTVVDDDDSEESDDDDTDESDGDSD